MVGSVIFNKIIIRSKVNDKDNFFHIINNNI